MALAANTSRPPYAATRSAGKPAPDPYRRAAELLDLAPEDCLAVEDSVTGTTAAERAGCPVLVVPNDVEVPVGHGGDTFLAGRTRPR